jgi:hypothetical protein
MVDSRMRWFFAHSVLSGKMTQGLKISWLSWGGIITGKGRKNKVGYQFHVLAMFLKKCSLHAGRIRKTAEKYIFKLCLSQLVLDQPEYLFRI